MARLALYRKYRPKDFSEVNGQEHIMKVLENAAKNSSFSHAYIFCGPRGIGKTSVARIMAKAVNCLKPKEGNPCNKCLSCVSINDQTALDIVEIDAASNRGIDEIRDLREKVKFSPNELKYKVFIIDEVHMLTKEAFNALLKTLEEPPEHVLFIMATTEIHKIPATVVSRCQRFDFKRIGTKELEEGLGNIAKKENIRIEKEAIASIARVSEGGFRDAISILDQISMNAGDKEVTNKQVMELVGIIGGEKITKLAEMIDAGQKKEALEFLSILLSSGADIGQLTKGLMLFYREKIQENVDDTILIDRYVYAIDILSDCNGNFRYALYPQLSLEVAIIKIISCFNEGAQVGNTKERQKDGRHTEEKRVSKTSQDKTEKGKTKEPDNSSLERWDQILFEIKSKNNSIHAIVRESQPLFEGNEVCLVFPYKFHKERIEDRKNRQIVEEAISKIYGDTYTVVCRLGKRGAEGDVGEEPKTKKDTMNDFLDVLGGEIVG